MAGLDELAYKLVMSVPRYRKRLGVAVIMGLVSLYLAHRRYLERRAADMKAGLIKRPGHRVPVKRVGVDSEFLQQLSRILPICVPGLATREFGLLMSLAGILIVRTWLDIWFSAFNGVVVRSIVSRDWPLFMKNAIILFGFMMWPMVRE